MPPQAGDTREGREGHIALVVLTEFTENCLNTKEHTDTYCVDFTNQNRHGESGGGMVLMCGAASHPPFPICCNWRGFELLT